MSTTTVPAPAGASSSGRMARFGVPLGIVGVIVLLVLPVPSFVLDALLATNLGLAVLILLRAMLVRRALDLSVFPSLLLVTTLARLALNVSSTRLILLHGEAGHVIDAFGHIVVGGNLVVGLVIFLILVVIQFVVITAGAGRVAEVSARFTLDAMPGKQMAIDADLNAGLISDEQARSRRAEVAREADYFGSMDGAAKFTKGDAIAAVVMVGINLVAGMAVGILQMHLGIAEAVQRFSLLSVGDGLVSQIPALLISVASGIIVTRVEGEDDSEAGLGADLVAQLLRHPHSLRLAAVLVAALGLMPGLPKVPFLAVGAALGVASTRAAKAEQRRAAAQPTAPEQAAPQAGEASAPVSTYEDLTVDPLRLELAPDLLDLLDAGNGADLAGQVRLLRQRIAAELGIVVPAVRTADDPGLPAGTYVVKVHGVEVARGEAPAGCVMVLASAATGPLPGRATVDPVFGEPAAWLAASLAEPYALAGATVVDRAGVLVTHLAEVVRSSAPDLLTRQDVQTLLDAAREHSPVVVGEVDGDRIGVADVQRVLVDLLAEGVPVRNLPRLLEAVTAKARETRAPEALLEAARAALGPTICAAAAGADGTLAALTFEAALEQQLMENVRTGDGGSWLALDAATMHRLLEGIAVAVSAVETAALTPAIVCSAALRPAVRRLLAAGRPDLRVLSYPELSRTVTVKTVGEIHLA